MCFSVYHHLIICSLITISSPPFLQCQIVFVCHKPTDSFTRSLNRARARAPGSRPVVWTVQHYFNAGRTQRSEKRAAQSAVENTNHNRWWKSRRDQKCEENHSGGNGRKYEAESISAAYQRERESRQTLTETQREERERTQKEGDMAWESESITSEFLEVENESEREKRLAVDDGR